MASDNGLICFTNCLLPLEDGTLVEKDLWIDERRGVILDAQVCGQLSENFTRLLSMSNSVHSSFGRRGRPRLSILEETYSGSLHFFHTFVQWWLPRRGFCDIWHVGMKLARA